MQTKEESEKAFDILTRESLASVALIPTNVDDDPGSRCCRYIIYSFIIDSIRSISLLLSTMPSLYTHSCIYCFIFLCFCVKRERDSSESIIISHLRSIRPTGTTLSTNQANTAGPLCCICNLIHPDCQSPIAEKAAAAFNHLKTLPSANIAGSIHISNAHISQKVLGIC